LTSSLIADPLLGPGRSLLQLAVPRPADRRNRPRLSLLEPVGEGGVATANTLGRRSKCAHPGRVGGGRLGGHLDPAEGIRGTV